MLKNVTVTVEEEVLRWARREAADKGTSVSRLLCELMEREMHTRDGYMQALERSMERSRKGWPLDAAKRMSREEAHARRR